MVSYTIKRTSQQSHSEVYLPKRNGNTRLHRKLSVLSLEYGGGYTTMHVCQNSWNCMLTTGGLDCI